MVLILRNTLYNLVHPVSHVVFPTCCYVGFMLTGTFFYLVLPPYLSVGGAVLYMQGPPVAFSQIFQ
jgi:hypothetical protein